MTGWRARQLCRDLVFVGGHFDRYQRFGDEVMSVFHDFTPRVERVSIDEAFLDVTGAVHLFGTPTEIAIAIRRRVRDEIGLPLSVGVARTKHLAKVASQVAKPDGIVAVAPERESEFLAPLPVGLIWGVGPTTERRLHDSGIDTIGQLAKVGSPHPRQSAGRGDRLEAGRLSVNVDERAVEAPARSKSMGAQAALGRRAVTPSWCDRRSATWSTGWPAACDGRAWPAAGDGPRPLSPHALRDALGDVARCDLDDADTDRGGGEARPVSLVDNEHERDITLLAVSVSNLHPEHSLQLELPSTTRHAMLDAADAMACADAALR